MGTKLGFIDTETTSLDDRSGEVWEVALVLRPEDGPDESFLWQLPIQHLELADPQSLKMNNFHERRWQFAESLSIDKPTMNRIVHGGHHSDSLLRIIIPYDKMSAWAEHFVDLTNGIHLVGNVTSFDEERLRKLLRMWRQTPMWHYHVVCVENLIAGRMGIQPPWKSKELSEMMGVPVPEDQHGALPDARWARDMYDAVFNHHSVFDEGTPKAEERKSPEKEGNE